MNTKFEDALATAIARFEALSPEEKIAHMAAQRESWGRGEMGMRDVDTRPLCPRDRCHRRERCADPIRYLCEHPDA